MKNQKRKNKDSASIDIQIPGQMHIEDFPEFLPNNYFVGGAKVRTEEDIINGKRKRVKDKS